MSPRSARAASRGLVALAVVLALVAPGALRTAGPVLLVVAALAGLPHGAADALLLTGLSGVARAVVPLLAYACAAGTAVAVALAFPAPALAALLVLSVVHFAEGEAAFDRLDGGPGDAVAAAAVGTAVVALPLALRPDQTRPLLDALAPDLAGLLLGPTGRLLLVGVAGALVLAALARGSTASRTDVVLVVALTATAPPLVAFAVWFAGWHALRHGVRLTAAAAPDPSRRAVLVLATAGGAALLGALTLLTPGAAPAVLLGLLALTVPHAVVVERVLGSADGGAREVRQQV